MATGGSHVSRTDTMKRAIAGAYFAVVCLHCVFWLRMLVWPNAGSPDVVEMLGILTVLGSPLILVAALLGLVEPRRPVALITVLIVLGLCLDVSRAVMTVHAATNASHVEGVIAGVTLLLGVAGVMVVARGHRRRPAKGDAGLGNAG